MILHPQNLVKTVGSFTFCGDVNATAHSCLNKGVIKEFWHNFTFQSSKLNICKSNEFIFLVGNAEPLSLDGFDYSINITPDGICVYAENEKNLIRGFLALIDRFRAINHDEALATRIDCCKIKDKPMIKNRMVHFCIFPETTLAFMRKIIRLAAFLRYTHIVVEFWGTLKMDCLKELAWKDAFSKDEVLPIFQEAQTLGVEIIPMLNHWGHATFSRAKTGKHVVLDQNLALAPLFSSTGWEWNLNNPKVKELHKNIRKELMDLCGDGEYFHIGCDEAYSAETKEDFETLVNYINDVSKELENAGRKAIMWGDMLLHKATLENKTDNVYYLSCPNEEWQKIVLDKLSRSIVIADWEYEARKYPIETALFFKEKGFKVLCCPFNGRDNIIESANTIKRNDLLGVLHTTWHHIGTHSGVWGLAHSAASGWGEAVFNYSHLAYQGNEVASILRKLDFPNGNYDNSGWTRKQILGDLYE